MNERDRQLAAWDAAVAARDLAWREWMEARDEAVEKNTPYAWSVAWNALHLSNIAARRVPVVWAMIEDPPPDAKPATNEPSVKPPADDLPEDIPF